MHVLWLKNEWRAKKPGTVASSAYCYTTHKSGMAAVTLATSSDFKANQCRGAHPKMHCTAGWRKRDSPNRAAPEWMLRRNRCPRRMRSERDCGKNVL